jgi:hypothetical protein
MNQYEEILIQLAKTLNAEYRHEQDSVLESIAEYQFFKEREYSPHSKRLRGEIRSINYHSGRKDAIADIVKRLSDLIEKQ